MRIFQSRFFWLQGLISTLVLVLAAGLLIPQAQAVCLNCCSAINNCCQPLTPGINGCCGPAINQCEPDPAPVVQPEEENHDVCGTDGSVLALLGDRNVIQVFSDFTDKNPNGMLITEIPLSAVRAVTDEEKASKKPITLLTKDSEYAKGWTVVLYWYDNHYGAIITGEGGAFRDDTTPECGF